MSRKYRMVRIASGDYILPSNDGKNFFRVWRYEDGPSHGLEDWPRDIMLWAFSRWIGRKPIAESDPLDDDCWGEHQYSFKTRAAAIEAALQTEGVAAIAADRGG